MAAVLTPLQLQAGATLLQNQGIRVPTTLSNVINDYRTQSFIEPLYATITTGSANILSNATLAELQTIASYTNVCPALADSIVANIITSNAGPIVTSTTVNPSTATPGMTGMISITANTYLGNGDNSIFAQMFSAAQGYCQITNTFIDSAVNANDYLADTFTDMDNLTTGELTAVNLSTQSFGSDLEKLGQTINLGNLDNLGSPLALIQQIVKTAGIVTPIIVALTNVGINENIVLDLNNPNIVITDTNQKLMYQALTLITDDDLTQILQILNVTTVGINTLADLLNPVKMFPNSFQSLTTPTCSGLRGIYMPEPAIPGTVNSKLETQLPGTSPGISLLRLSKIIPSDQALANKALGISLQQITNVTRISLPKLATAYLGIETNRDLPDINAQLKAVPTDVTDYYLNTLASGSGENGTILLTDILGTAIGTNQTDPLAQVVSTLSSIDTADLGNIYSLMQEVVDGDYGDPTTGPITGLPSPYDAGEPYANADVVISTVLIPASQDEIGNIISSLTAEQLSTLNNSYDDMANQLSTEKQFQIKATIDFSTAIGNSQATTQSMIFALPAYGLETKVGGTAEFLEAVANVDIAGGQAIVGCLREGRTQVALNEAGVISANQVSDTPTTVPPQADLIPSEYNQNQANNRIIV